MYVKLKIVVDPQRGIPRPPSEELDKRQYYYTMINF